MTTNDIILHIFFLVDTSLPAINCIAHLVMALLFFSKNM